MTFPEFLAKLAETPRDWRGRIWLRRGADYAQQCPLTAVAGCFYGLEQWQDAAAALGLPSDLAHQIATAADNDDLTYPPDMRLRAALLAACGLPVPS